MKPSALLSSGHDGRELESAEEEKHLLDLNLTSPEYTPVSSGVAPVHKTFALIDHPQS